MFGIYHNGDKIYIEVKRITTSNVHWLKAGLYPQLKKDGSGVSFCSITGGYKC